jgi:hypothetical protein
MELEQLQLRYDVSFDEKTHPMVPEDEGDDDGPGADIFYDASEDGDEFQESRQVLESSQSASEFAYFPSYPISDRDQACDQAVLERLFNVQMSSRDQLLPVWNINEGPEVKLARHTSYFQTGMTSKGFTSGLPIPCDESQVRSTMRHCVLFSVGYRPKSSRIRSNTPLSTAKSPCRNF